MKEVEVYHFIGIGGIGMSGLARILLSRGEKVSGSDLSSNYVTEALGKNGATIYFGHAAENVPEGARVIFSTDIQQDNPELHVARLKNLCLMHRSDLLKELSQEKKLLAVAGTHGKTTTSALLSHVLVDAGYAPSYAVGGIVNNYSLNAQEGFGKHFVLEADESDGTFLKYDYEGAIVTNIDTDHICHFGSFEKVIDSFKVFIKKSKNKELLWLCADDERLQAHAQEAMTYGMNKNADLVISNFRQNGFFIEYDVNFRNVYYKSITLPLLGEHNAKNSAAVFGLLLVLGISEETIRKAFLSFKGVKRRMDKKMELNSVAIFDDYAHHPTEIRATLKGLRKAVPEQRIIAVFQPHRYSRMQYILDELKGAFSEADIVVVTDLYTANEKPIAGVSTEKIVALISADHHNVQYIPRSMLTERLHEKLMPHDVLITMGAGDITKLGGEIKSIVEKEGIRKLNVLVLLGGESCEHEVSCTSAKTAQTHLRNDLYNARSIVIGLDGVMRLQGDNGKAIPSSDDNILSKEVLEEFVKADVVVPILHGPNGEDGTIQGFLETLHKPYTGCDVRSSAVSMDKIMCKQIAEHVGIPTTPFVAVSFDEWGASQEEIVEEVIRKLELPYFVKPSHLGSSVGVTKVIRKEDLTSACEKAFMYDTHILVEQGITMREIEYAVLGNRALYIPAPCEVKTEGQFYSYEAKYTATGFAVDIRAHLSDEEIEKGRRVAETMYRKLGCSGLARIDLFLGEDGLFYFNEINPIPGMTPNSAYPKIMKQTIGLEKLFDTLIIAAFERARRAEKVFGYSCKNLSRT